MANPPKYIHEIIKNVPPSILLGSFKTSNLNFLESLACYYYVMIQNELMSKNNARHDY